MKTKTTLTGLILLNAVLFLSGCYKPWHSIDGNNDVQSETRQLTDFHRVFNEGEFDVYIIIDGLNEVTIEAESNLIPMIRTRIEGSSLVIDTKDNLRDHEPMKVYVHASDLTEIGLSGSGIIETEEVTPEDFEISLSGSGNIYSKVSANYIDCDISGSGNIELDADCNKLDARISGSGEMQMEGDADYADLKISGSGDIRAYDLILQDCDANISGSGDIYITVEDHLDATISGSGNIYYLGNPLINTHISGSGSVIHP